MRRPSLLPLLLVFGLGCGDAPAEATAGRVRAGLGPAPSAAASSPTGSGPFEAAAPGGCIGQVRPDLLPDGDADPPLEGPGRLAPLRTLEASGPVLGVGVAEHGARLVAVGADRSWVWTFSDAEGEPTFFVVPAPLDGHWCAEVLPAYSVDTPLRAEVELDQSGNLGVVAGPDRGLRVFDLLATEAMGPVREVLDGQRSRARVIWGGQMMVTAGPAGVEARDVVADRPRWVVALPEAWPEGAEPLALALAPQAGWFALQGPDGSLWRAQAGAQPQRVELPADEGPERATRTLFSIDDAGRLRVVSGGRVLDVDLQGAATRRWGLDPRMEAVALSVDGGRLVVVDSNLGGAQVLDAESGTLLAMLSTAARPEELALSRSGDAVVSRSGRRLRVFAVPSEAPDAPAG